MDAHDSFETDEDGHRRKASITVNIEKQLNSASLAATAKGSIDSLGSAVTVASSVGSKAVTSVGSSASAAGGWLAKRLSSS